MLSLGSYLVTQGIIDFIKKIKNKLIKNATYTTFTTFFTVFLAEMGDKTQLTTITKQYNK